MPNWTTASAMSALVTPSDGACPPHGSGIATGAAWSLMPCTTALISSRDVHACATGVSPRTTVVPTKPAVMSGLASQTSRVIRGMPRKVPTITGPDATYPVFPRRVGDIGIAGQAAAIDAGRLIAENADHTHVESIVFRPAPGGIPINA